MGLPWTERRLQTQNKKDSFWKVVCAEIVCMEMVTGSRQSPNGSLRICSWWGPSLSPNGLFQYLSSPSLHGCWGWRVRGCMLDLGLANTGLGWALREDCTRPGVKGCPSVGQRGRRDAQDGPGAPREVLHHLGPRFPHWPEGKIVSPAKLLCI